GIVVGLLLLATAAAAQVSASSRATGHELLSEARAAAEQAPANVRVYSLDVVAVTQYLAGDPPASLATTQAAIAAFQVQISALNPSPAPGAMVLHALPTPALQHAQRALIEAHLHHLAKDAAGALAWTAVARSWLPEMGSDRGRGEVLPLLFQYAWDSGDRTGADRTLALAMSLSPNADGYLPELASKVAAAGEADAALELAQRSGADAQQIIANVASSQAAAGDIVGARHTLQPLRGYRLQQALAAVAEAEVNAGDQTAAGADFAAALATLPPGNYRMLTVAQAEGRAGLLPQALALLTGIKPAGDWTAPALADNLEQLAREAVKDHQPGLARRCFAAAAELLRRDTSDPPGFLEHEQEDLSMWQAQSGDIAAALQTAAGLDATRRDQAIERIADAQANADDLPGARITLARLPSPPTHNGQDIAIAMAEARHGDFTGGLALARQGSPSVEALFETYCMPNRTRDCVEAARALPAAQARSSALLGIAERMLGVRRPIDAIAWVTY
ncbi:MAG: hypothetical protein ACRD1M_10690, partial [Terriglobales bacterium]